jgi:hypothetical protein
MQESQSRTGSKPNIYPKPPRQPASDFTSQSYNGDKTRLISHPAHSSTIHSQRHHARRLDQVLANPAEGKLYPLHHATPPGAHFPPNHHDERGQHIRHRSSDGQAFDGSHTIRRSSGAGVSRMFPSTYSENSATENAVLALEILSSLCMESGWTWIDGMLVGGCLAYGLEDYQKAMRWYTRIITKDAT